MKGESGTHAFLPRTIKLQIYHLMEFRAKMGRRLNENAMIIPHCVLSYSQITKEEHIVTRNAHIHCNMHRNTFSLNYRHSISDTILKSGSTASWDRETTMCLLLEDFLVAQVIVGCKEI